MEILVLRFDALGDTIVTLPFLENLKSAYGESRVTVAASPRGYAALEGCGFVDRTVVFDLKDKEAAARFTQESAGKYDMAFIVTEKPDAYKIALQAKIPERIGFSPGIIQPFKKIFCSVALTKGYNYVNSPAVRQGLHEVERQLKLLELAGAEPEKKPYRLCLRPEDLARAQSVAAADSRPMMAVHYSEKWMTDGWTEKMFVQVMKALADRYGGSFRLIMTCGTQDREPMEILLEEIGGFEGFCDPLFGRWAALLSLCGILITMDTSAAHVAAGLALPSVVVYPEKYFEHVCERWHPWMSDYRSVCRRELLRGNGGDAVGGLSACIGEKAGELLGLRR